MRDALGLAERLAQPTTLALTLNFASVLHYQRGEWSAARESAERMRVIADAHDLTASATNSLVLRFCAGVREGRTALAEEFAERLAAGGTTMRNATPHAILLAETALAVGDVERAAAALGGIPADRRDAALAPEIERLEGEVCVRRGERADAESHFRRAIATARRRSERSLELRAATSVARLLAADGRREDARRTLGEVYGWFTEGFDTADLRAARALLTEIGGPTA